MGLSADQGAGPCELKSRTRYLQVTFNVKFRNLRLREEFEELLSNHTTFTGVCNAALNFLSIFTAVKITLIPRSLENFNLQCKGKLVIHQSLL